MPTRQRDGPAGQFFKRRIAERLEQTPEGGKLVRWRRENRIDLCGKGHG
jgi:hypothetical protein